MPYQPHQTGTTFEVVTFQQIKMSTIRVAEVIISVPIRSAGNVINNKPIPFEISKEEDLYTATPSIPIDERRIANLPPEMQFEVKNGKAISTRGAKDGNAHVLDAIVQELKDGNNL